MSSKRSIVVSPLILPQKSWSRDKFSIRNRNRKNI